MVHSANCSALRLPPHVCDGSPFLICRDAAAVQRIEQWEAVWRNAEGHTVGATAAAVQRFNALVAQASQLGAALRCPANVPQELYATVRACIWM
jgi:hypothetical protein